MVYLKLHAKNLWLDVLDWSSVHLDHSVAFLGVRNGSGRLLATERLH